MLFYFIVSSAFFRENIIPLVLKFILLPKWFRALAPSCSPSQKQNLLVTKANGSQLGLLKHLLLGGGFSLRSASHSPFRALLVSLADEEDQSSV